MARHRALFRDEVLSELMPPLEPDGTSLLWESLGRHFTGLSYQEADRLSQSNKEFIRALFPQDPIYVTLLPPHVQELIGQVGPDTRGVEKMLRAVGFSYAQPHRSVRRRPALSSAHRRDLARAGGGRGARRRPAGARADRAACARYWSRASARSRRASWPCAPRRAGRPCPEPDARVHLPEEVRRALDVATGDEVAVVAITRD